MNQEWKEDWETSREIDGMLSMAGDSLEANPLKQDNHMVLVLRKLSARKLLKSCLE